VTGETTLAVDPADTDPSTMSAITCTSGSR
jgi:hypothetical protein